MNSAVEEDVVRRLAGIVGSDEVEALELAPHGASTVGRSASPTAAGTARVMQARHASSVPLASPRDERELVELLRLAARDRLAVLPCGLGSKLGWYRRPSRVDFALSTRRLCGVVAYEPGDGTITARAGSTIAELATAANAGGHHLSPAVVRPERATLGGVLAAGESGTDRLRYSPVRHQVLGMKVALGDGSIARGGGRLVKNVTGFDLHRLYCGSHGTLCVILEASLRLHPRQDREAWVTTGAVELCDALELARTALDAGVRYDGLQLVADDPRGNGGSAWEVRASLAARSEVLEVELAALGSVWPRHEVLLDDDARAARHEVCALRFETGSVPWLHIACTPSRLARVLASTLEICADPALAPRVVAEPAIAYVDVELRGRDAREATPQQVAGCTTRVRTELTPLGASVTLREGGAALDLVDPFDDPGAGVELMQRLRSALDPHAVFAPGRSHAALDAGRS